MTLKSNESIDGKRSPGAEASASSSRHSYRNFALRAIVGIAIVTFLVWRYDARSILSLLARERPAYFAAAIGVYLLTLVLCAYRWRLLAAILRLDASFTDFLAFRFIATFANTLIPGVAGGDALRAIYLGRRTSRLGEAVASVLADRIVGLIGLFWLAAGAAIFLRERGLPSALTTLPILTGLIALAVFVASPLIIRFARLMPSRLSRYARLHRYLPGASQRSAGGLGALSSSAKCAGGLPVPARPWDWNRCAAHLVPVLCADRRRVCQLTANHKWPGSSRGRLSGAIRHGRRGSDQCDCAGTALVRLHYTRGAAWSVGVRGNPDN